MYSFNFFMPMYALLCANLLSRILANPRTAIPKAKSLIFTTVVFVVVYPYGAFQSNRYHDIFNSLLLMGSAFTVMYLAGRGHLRASVVSAAVAIAAFANFSQTMNYRNEPDTEYTFCEKARAEYQQTGQPVHTKEPWSDAKYLVYCRGIPIVYE
jgi:hypothetical protein